MQQTTNYDFNLIENSDKITESLTGLNENFTIIDNEMITFQKEITSQNKLSADLVDDTSTIHKFVDSKDLGKIAYAEQTTNKVTSLSGSSTNVQYPSAKLVYDQLTDKQTQINSVVNQSNDLLDQIPVGTVEDTYINVQDSSNLPIKDIEVEGNTSQAGDPTPTVPVPIKVVTGDNTVNVLGKNILQLSGNNQTYTYQNTHTITDNSYTSMPSANWARTDYKFRVKPNTTYTFSANINFEGITYPSTWHQTIKGVQSQTTYKDGSSTITNKKLSQTFTTTEQDYEIKISFWSSIGGGASAVPTKTTYTNIQLEAGPTATTFEPYQSQSQLLSLGNIELAKIGDYRDYIFKDKTSGKWYKHNVIGKLVFNGSESWTKSSSTTYDGYWTGLGSIVTTERTGLCNYLKHATQLTEGTFDIKNNGTNTQSVFWAYFELGSIGTPQQFQTWLSTHNLISYYVLANQTDTEITDTILIEQLDALYNSQTYKNITNIFTVTDNEEPILNITYRKDLQTLTDKIALLEARVELLEG